MNAQPLDHRRLYLRLAAYRGGEADLHGFVSSYSVWGGACCLTYLGFAGHLFHEV